MVNIVIDPITRIEGHLRVEVQVEDGSVTNAWTSGTMFRGIELVLKDRDPRDAWVFAQRVCGVCTTVHALASVRAVENALGIQIPDNARILRNLIEGAQFIQDHVIHFYHLHALDWVDVESAIGALPDGDLKARLEAFYYKDKDAGITRGPFANGYWGHPAYKLDPEENLAAVAHYLAALEWQREYIKFHAMLGGRNPHLETYLVGGMAIPLDSDPASEVAINPATIQRMRELSTQAQSVCQSYLQDVLMVAGKYREWGGWGGGYGNNYLSYGDFPDGSEGLYLPAGAIVDGELQSVDESLIREYVARSWYNYTGPGGGTLGKAPAEGETQPRYTGLNTHSKYSWLKAPRYSGHPMEVGPLARVLIAYLNQHEDIVPLVTYVLDQLDVDLSALYSTLGRVAARCIETLAIANRMPAWLDELEANIRAGDLTIHSGDKWNPSTWPHAAQGYGTTEAPRGSLGHWVGIEDGKIAHYQMVVPTTWNASPRDAIEERDPLRGPLEEALIGTPVADPQRPLEILRTVHSFDPCIACAVHLVDCRNRELTRVDLSTF